VVLAVAPAVTLDEASSLSRYHDRGDTSSIVMAGATANTTEGNSRKHRGKGGGVAKGEGPGGRQRAESVTEG